MLIGSIEAMCGNGCGSRGRPGLIFWRRRTAVSHEPLDVPLVDEELLAEMALTVELIIACGSADRPLPQDEIDRLLGLDKT